MERQRELGRNRVFCRIKDERKNLSFFKIFQGADLSSECMGAVVKSCAFSVCMFRSNFMKRVSNKDFMKRVSNKDFSYKMVIRAQWGSSWKVEISKNPRFYYMEKCGWNQFVSDNALGDNEFITFTHKGKMWFDVNIYQQNGKEIVIPRNPPTMAPSSGMKKEQGESSYKEVKKEDETGDSMGGEELEVRKKKAEGSKTSKKKKITSKKVVNSVEIGESSRGVELKVRKKNAEKTKTSKKNKIKSEKVKNAVPEFKITIRKSYLKFLAIPKLFVEEHIPNKSKIFTIHHSKKGNGSWEVMCLVRETRTIFSSGWTKLAREYPLRIGDRCTFKLIKPTEFLLISKKAREKITMID